MILINSKYTAIKIIAYVPTCKILMFIVFLLFIILLTMTFRYSNRTFDRTNLLFILSTLSVFSKNLP